jgi:hypothetical protein
MLLYADGNSGAIQDQRGSLERVNVDERTGGQDIRPPAILSDESDQH